MQEHIPTSLLMRVHHHSLLGAGKSLEALDVVATGLLSALGVVLPASLHALKHGRALRVGNAEGATSEVSAEVVTEGRDSSRGGGDVAGPDVRARRCEHVGVIDGKTLHVRVVEVANAHEEATLERMADDVERMRVVGRPLERAEPGARLSESLPNLLGLLSAPVEFHTHLGLLL